jgi:menaquinone-dependent protoporphyrinogen IX oxidase
MDVSFGIKPLKNTISDFDKVILAGPIWIGKFIAPLKNFVTKYRNQINELVFITCCGSDFKMKDEKFGHGLVFKKVNNLLNEINFTGEIQTRFSNFISKIST